MQLRNHELNCAGKDAFLTGRQRAKLTRNELDVGDDRAQTLASESITRAQWQGDGKKAAQAFIAHFGPAQLPSGARPRPERVIAAFRRTRREWRDGYLFAVARC